jgi:pyruvate dehydrogenase E2 component (dihydrolipoamide acetyltransferase)
LATEVKLPRLGQGMESGTIVRWLKSEGDQVEKGEPLYEVDTEKVTQEVEADASGVLLRISVAEGEVPVGRTIAVIGSEGEEVPDAGPEAGADGGGRLAGSGAGRRARAWPAGGGGGSGGGYAGCGGRRDARGDRRPAHQGIAAGAAHRA